MENAISLVQLPVIREKLLPVSEEIDRRVREALSLAVTPETLTSVKKVRAQLRKDYEELETQRKTLKSALLEPYRQFEEEVYKPLISVLVEEADEELKRKIRAVEDELKKEKEEELKGYFRELADSFGLPWLGYDRCEVRVGMSRSLKSMKDEVYAFLDLIRDDVNAISAMPDGAEIMAEYKQCLSFGKAVGTVARRREAVEREQREREERLAAKQAEEAHIKEVEEAAKAYAAPAPEPEEEPEEEQTATLTFTVTATIEKLRELKRFLNEGGYHIG